MTHPAWVRFVNDNTHVQSKEIAMGEPPAPTPTPARDGEEHAAQKQAKEISMPSPLTAARGLREEPARQEQAMVCCNLQTALLILTSVNTALLCIVLGFLIGHR
jgi:hypothetical protein